MDSSHESKENLQTGSKTSLHDRKSSVVKGMKDADGDDLLGDDENVETLVQRLNLLHQSNPYHDLDSRSHVVRQKIKENCKNTAKTVVEKAEESKPQIEKRLEESNRELEDLLAFGNEIISNIKVSNEKRQLLRREFDGQQRIDLENTIHKESTETAARYNDIVARWSELGELDEPMIMSEKLKEQKERVIELLRNKEDIIAKCQREIDRIDERFEEELLKQQSEICTMVERVNGQISLMKQAYSHHLNLLENTLESERQTVAMKEQEKWKIFYDTIRDKEKFKLDMTEEKKSFYNNEIQRIMTQQEEITRSTRIRLEKESEALLYDLRCKKNETLINSEKLDYNYQVLQKRNEENVIINNQQKRRVGKINVAVVELKKRIKSAQMSAENTISKLTNEIQKLHDSITDLEQKNESFHLHNRKKLIRVWDINFQELKALIERIYEIDRILHEQQLGVPWQKPALDLEEFDLVKKEKASLFGDSQSDRSESSSNIEDGKQNIVIGNSLPQETGKQEQILSRRHRDILIRKAEDERKRQEERIEKRLLRNILRKVADLGGFLVEDRLLEFLEPYTEERKALVRIDNIFAALSVTDMAAVKRLVEFFKPYAWCPNCMKGIPHGQLKKLYRPCQVSNNPCYDCEGDELSHPDQSIESAEESISINKAQSKISSIKIVNDQFQSGAKASITSVCDNHYLMVESAMVLTALNEFINQDTKSFEEGSRRHHTLRASRAISGICAARSKLSTASIEFNDELVREYWHKFHNYMPRDKLKLWHSLEHGLHHYLEVLKQREQLDKECIALRRQNMELKHLLQKFKL